MNKEKKDRFIDFTGYVFCFLFIVAGVLVSLNRYWQFEVFFYDFGIFDQAIWKVSRFMPPIIEHYVVGGKWIFADHLSPSIFILSPLYWFTKHSEIILIAQVVLVGLSGIVLYAIGKEVTKHKLFSLSILVCYLLFTGLQNAVITDFHEVTIMVLPFLLTFWAAIKKKLSLYFFFLLLTLGFKESTFTLGIGIAVAIFFLRKDWRKIAFYTFIISVLWGILSIKIAIPFFSGGSYYYNPTISSEISKNLLFLFDNSIKRHTLFFSFASFGLLPLLAPAFWGLLLGDFIVRFLPQNTQTRWDLGLHYSAQLAPILALSSIYSFYIIRKFKLLKKHISLVSLLIVLNAIFIYRFILHGPLGLAYNPAFYDHTNDFGFLNDIVAKVPKNAKIMTQNNLAVRFTHQDVLLLRTNYAQYNPDYILVDIRNGQNANNFFGSGDISTLFDKLKKDPNYEVVYNTTDQYLFQKK